MYPLEPKSENALQAQICTVLNFVQLPYFSIPNGTYKKSVRTRNIYTNTGLKSGVPDLFICRPFTFRDRPYHGLFIEVKLGDKGKVTANQQAWHDKLLMEGYQVIVVRSIPQLYSVLIHCYPREAGRINNIRRLASEQDYEF